MIFEDFWQLYAYKISKKTARTAWLKLSEDDQRAVMEHLPERLVTDKQWVEWGSKPYPATFLNGERWEDEYEKCGGANSKGNGEGIIERLQRVSEINSSGGIQRDNKVVRLVSR